MGEFFLCYCCSVKFKVFLSILGYGFIPLCWRVGVQKSTSLTSTTSTTRSFSTGAASRTSASEHLSSTKEHVRIFF